MRQGARIQSAIDVLEEIERGHRPAHLVLGDWGRANRFAGSGDRAAIGNLVFDVLRRRASTAWKMGSDTPRALALGALSLAWELPGETIESWCDGSKYSAAPLSQSEKSALESEPDSGAPAWVRGDYPEWLSGEFDQVFGERAAEEGAALARRAPIDLRVNTLKANRDKLLESLKSYHTKPTPYSPIGLRIPAPEGPARSPHVEAAAAHGRGHFEVQDEGSQLAALLTGAASGDQVMDLCAGAGGKTLALAALMDNHGQIHAYDSDRLRLRRIFERLKRAGVRNTQVLEAGDDSALQALADKMDIVLVDAPCTGSGVWRRRPDAKWRVREEALGKRVEEQRTALDRAADLVKPGGRLAYVTCSVLARENGQQVTAFLERFPDFELRPYDANWRQTIGSEPPASADGRQAGALLLTPASHGTDGFFIAVMDRRSRP